jgi:hypothetical protein
MLYRHLVVSRCPPLRPCPSWRSRYQVSRLNIQSIRWEALLALLAAGYADLAARLGPRVLVGQTVPPGTELALGLVAGLGLGPLIVIGAGSVLVELLADRVVALPPWTSTWPPTSSAACG